MNSEDFLFLQERIVAILRAHFPEPAPTEQGDLAVDETRAALKSRRH